MRLRLILLTALALCGTALAGPTITMRSSDALIPTPGGACTASVFSDALVINADEGTVWHCPSGTWIQRSDTGLVIGTAYATGGDGTEGDPWTGAGAAIQAAVDKIPAGTQHGAPTVVFPAGYYLLSDNELAWSHTGGVVGLTIEGYGAVFRPDYTPGTPFWFLDTCLTNVCEGTSDPCRVNSDCAGSDVEWCSGATSVKLGFETYWKGIAFQGASPTTPTFGQYSQVPTDVNGMRICSGYTSDNNAGWKFENVAFEMMQTAIALESSTGGGNQASEFRFTDTQFNKLRGGFLTVNNPQSLMTSFAGGDAINLWGDGIVLGPKGGGAIYVKDGSYIIGHDTLAATTDPIRATGTCESDSGESCDRDYEASCPAGWDCCVTPGDLCENKWWMVRSTQESALSASINQVIFDGVQFEFRGRDAGIAKLVTEYGAESDTEGSYVNLRIENSRLLDAYVDKDHEWLVVGPEARVTFDNVNVQKSVTDVDGDGWQDHPTFRFTSASRSRSNGLIEFIGGQTGVAALRIGSDNAVMGWGEAATWAGSSRYGMIRAEGGRAGSGNWPITGQRVALDFDRGNPGTAYASMHRELRAEIIDEQDCLPINCTTRPCSCERTLVLPVDAAITGVEFFKPHQSNGGVCSGGYPIRYRIGSDDYATTYLEAKPKDAGTQQREHSAELRTFIPLGSAVEDRTIRLWAMGTCSTTTTTSCQVDGDCPGGETCDGIDGEHQTTCVGAHAVVKYEYQQNAAQWATRWPTMPAAQFADCLLTTTEDGTVECQSCADGEVVAWDATTSAWVCETPAGGGTITGATASGGLEVSGSTLGMRTDCSASEVLAWVGSAWTCTAAGAGTGDMLKSTYDASPEDGVVDSAAAVAWSGITSRPAGLDDGDDDTTCDGAACDGTSFSNVTAAAVAANSVALGTGTTGDYVSGVTASGGIEKTGTEGATLGLLTTCGSSQILKWSGSAWECQPDAGGSSNSFETLDAPAGTDPVADSSTDTLTLAASGPLTITGDSGTDTLTFAVTAHTTDTGPSPDCSGTTTYQDGEGGCDDLSAVYQPLDTELTELAGLSCSNGEIAKETGGVWACAADDDTDTTCDGATFTNVAAATAAALAANGGNCSAGQFPLGVDAAGAVESCTDAATQAELDALDSCAELPGCIETSDAPTWTGLPHIWDNNGGTSGPTSRIATWKDNGGTERSYVRGNGVLYQYDGTSTDIAANRTWVTANDGGVETGDSPTWTGTHTFDIAPILDGGATFPDDDPGAGGASDGIVLEAQDVTGVGDFHSYVIMGNNESGHPEAADRWNGVWRYISYNKPNVSYDVSGEHAAWCQFETQWSDNGENESVEHNCDYVDPDGSAKDGIPGGSFRWYITKLEVRSTCVDHSDESCRVDGDCSSGICTPTQVDRADHSWNAFDNGGNSNGPALKVDKDGKVQFAFGIKGEQQEGGYCVTTTGGSGSVYCSSDGDCGTGTCVGIDTSTTSPGATWLRTLEIRTNQTSTGSDRDFYHLYGTNLFDSQTTNATANSIAGVRFDTTFSGSTTGRNVDTIRGLYSLVNLTQTGTGASVGTLVHFDTANVLTGSNIAVGNLFGVRIPAIGTVGGSTTVTNQAGVWIGDQKGLGTGYSDAIRIYDQSGDSYIRGNVRFLATDSYQGGHLQIEEGHLYYDSTNELFRWWDSDDGSLTSESQGHPTYVPRGTDNAWGVPIWGSTDTKADTGTEVCALAKLSCVEVVVGSSGCGTTQSGYYIALCKHGTDTAP